MSQRVQESVEVQAPAADVFRYWSNFENLPAFVSNVEEVRTTGTDTSHRKVKGPLGKSVQFEAKTTQMDPGRGIGWNTIEGDVMTSGEARFEEVAPGRTRIDVTMNHSDPPGGAVANVLSNPERNLEEDLQNFAKIVERGELGGPDAQTPSRETAKPSIE